MGRVALFSLFVGTIALRPAPFVLLRPAPAGPWLQATLQQEPGTPSTWTVRGGGNGKVYRSHWPSREAWIALLACQATLLAAVFGWMVAFAPEQLRVDAELRRTACASLRGACLPIQPLRLRGGFAPHLGQRTALAAATAAALSLSLAGRRASASGVASAPSKAAPPLAAGPDSGRATPPATPPTTLPATLPSTLPSNLPAARTPAQLERGPNSAGPDSNGAMEERYNLGQLPFTAEDLDPDPDPSLPIFPVLGAQRSLEHLLSEEELLRRLVKAGPRSG